mmetsp:Transcript_23421/g.34575  ORF Transcript_23421/g.34575 Transcript_23421/m.34575 type:complete len:105 (-) Transcript_23421:100-414(-)
MDAAEGRGGITADIPGERLISWSSSSGCFEKGSEPPLSANFERSKDLRQIRPDGVTTASSIDRIGFPDRAQTRLEEDIVCSESREAVIDSKIWAQLPRAAQQQL